MSATTSFILRNANVLDPAGGFSGPLDVHVGGSRVVSVDTDLNVKDAESFDFSGLFLGLVFDAIVLDADPGDLSVFLEPGAVSGVFKAGEPVVRHARLADRMKVKA
jgi:hypothetical protein